MNIIGIDIGTSATKIVEIDKNSNILNKMILNEKNSNKAFEIFASSNNIDKKNIEIIILTGVGSNNLNKIQNIPALKVDEFIAIAEGGKKLSNKENAIVVSVGTGTAFVKVEDSKTEHLRRKRYRRKDS